MAASKQYIPNPQTKCTKDGGGVAAAEGRKNGRADVEKKRVLRNSQIQLCQLQIRDALQSLFGHSFRTSESRSPCPSHSSSSSSVMELFANVRRKELFPLPLFVCLLSLPPFG